MLKAAKIKDLFFLFNLNFGGLICFWVQLKHEDFWTKESLIQV